jgi:hypothetical protein
MVKSASNPRSRLTKWKTTRRQVPTEPSPSSRAESASCRGIPFAVRPKSTTANPHTSQLPNHKAEDEALSGSRAPTIRNAGTIQKSWANTIIRITPKAPRPCQASFASRCPMIE